jgi:DMSO reductase family type II enzyme heme b subunit
MTIRRTTRLALAAVAVAFAAAEAGAQTAALRVVRVREQGPFRDPAAAFWQASPATAVTLLPQAMTLPSNLEPAVQSLQVKAVHDGKWVAFLLEWRDATESDRIVVDQFGDQVAIEFPSVFKKDALPSPMMGNPGGRVEIWQWRAAFQQDLARGRPQVTNDLYPNAHADVYPDELLRAIDARPYMGAVGVDNLITRADKSPVLEQIAEGWGSLTIQPDDQQADGKGAWTDGTWRVVVTHPLVGSESDARFTAGGDSAAAFAVWDGGSREVGPRKAWSTWIDVRFDE